MIDAPLADVVGADLEVPLVDGRHVPYVDLDHAASTPALVAVADEVGEVLPWYSSVHRGAGYKSRVSTALFEEARADVAAFVGARPDDVVVFTRSTTDALNMLASAVPAGGWVLTFDTEHHANLLPWRRGPARHRHLPMPTSAAAALAALDEALQLLPSGPALVSVAGASNVTGEVWPLRELAQLAHRHGARVCVDAAQLAPHAPIDMQADELDYVVLSGHKLYAPYGAGALVGSGEWLSTAEPFIAGGGAVRFVSTDDVAWAPLPERFEAGSPNVIGCVALGAACRALSSIGMDKVAAHEDELLAHARERLSAVPTLEQYAIWDGDHRRIGVVACNLPDHAHGVVAAALSAEHGIAVRNGCFCAHPAMVRLLGVGTAEVEALRSASAAGAGRLIPGAVRISMGLATTSAHIDAVAGALAEMAERGPRWNYRWSEHAGGWCPDPETRALPSQLVGAGRRHLDQSDSAHHAARKGN